ncbi:MAG: hypothetical protein LAO76_00775 [Acidobacteriia bacterium]|nr:hypothetical protein [Terriglobia bacterium]
MFYFQQLLQQGLNGIDRTAMIPTVVGIGYTILLIGFLIGLYQAAMRGGDVQSLAITGIKYLVIAIILANWSTVFREVNDSFNQVAQFIDNSSGAGDMFLSWFDQLKQQFANNGVNSILPSITASFAAITTALMVLLAYIIYAMMVVIFAFFYVLYGCVLYVLGPLVLALLPMAGVGQLAKSYATNLMIWNAWGILYAIFGSLITAIQFNRVDEVMNQGFLQGFFRGSSDATVLGMVSIFYALALGLIPFIAKKLISGDVGATAGSLVKAAATAAGALISAGAGFSAGVGAASEAAPAMASAGTGASAGAGTSAAASSSAPPPQPSLAQTIRAGVMSAVQGTAPTAPSSNGDGSAQQAAAASSGASSGGSSPRRSQSSSGFRPVGVTQTVAFHAGRIAGGIVSGNGKKGDGAQENA